MLDDPVEESASKLPPAGDASGKVLYLIWISPSLECVLNEIEHISLVYVAKAISENAPRVEGPTLVLIHAAARSNCRDARDHVECMLPGCVRLFCRCAVIEVLREGNACAFASFCEAELLDPFPEKRSPPFVRLVACLFNQKVRQRADLLFFQLSEASAP